MKYNSNIYVEIAIFRLVTFILILFSSQFLNAQLRIHSAHQQALGSTQNTFSGIESIFSNAAGLASAEDLSLIASVRQRFLVSDLNESALGIAIPIQEFGTFGLYIGTMGIESLKQQQFGLSYAREMSPDFRLGIHINLNRIDAQEYGVRQQLGWSIGGQYDFSKSINAGIAVHNLQYSGHDAPLDNLITIGIAYHSSSRAILRMEYSVQGEDDGIQAGIAYQFNNQMALQVGMNGMTSSYSLGISYRIQPLVVMNGSFQEHPFLGITPAVSLTYSKAQTDE